MGWGVLKKKVTILVLPQGLNKVKRYSIPRYLPIGSLFFVVTILIGLLVFSLYSYHQCIHFEGQEAELNGLRHKTAEQNVQIFAFHNKIRLLEREMAKLRQYDRKLRATADKAPLLDRVRAAVGGSDSEAGDPKANLKASAVQLIRQMHRDLDHLLAEASIHEQNQHELGKYLEDSKSIIASTPKIWPLRGPITSHFGYRRSPFGRRIEFHRGLDISAPRGTPIVAPSDGIVVSKKWNSGYGLILVINHGYGLVTRYAHLSQVYVEPGQRVRRGKRIAAVGRTGRTTGAHLHYETILNGIPINPMRFLTARK